MNAAIRSIQITAIGALLAAGTAHADWSNLSGNAQSNGLSAVVGPWAADETWSRSDMSCLISWVPITSGNRVFMVRQTYAQAPYNPPPGEARVHCLDLQTGATLWTFDCPFEPGDWTTVVYGARDGRVFVGRGGNGSSASARVHCLDAATGSLLWVSADEVSTGSYDGVVFMDNGDPIFASNTTMRRLDAQTGATVWNVTRTCSVSGNCGPARDGDAIYLDEVAPGGQKISRFNATTGQRLTRPRRSALPADLCSTSARATKDQRTTSSTPSATRERPSSSCGRRLRTRNRSRVTRSRPTEA